VPEEEVKEYETLFSGWSTDSDSAFIDVETRGQTGNSLVLSQTSHVLLKLHTTVHYF